MLSTLDAPNDTTQQIPAYKLMLRSIYDVQKQS